MPLCCRSSEASTRCAALTLMAAVVEGLGQNDRGAEAIQTLALKSVLKMLKDFSDAATLAEATHVLQVQWLSCCTALRARCATIL